MGYSPYYNTFNKVLHLKKKKKEKTLKKRKKKKEKEIVCLSKEPPYPLCKITSGRYPVLLGDSLLPCEGACLQNFRPLRLFLRRPQVTGLPFRPLVSSRVFRRDFFKFWFKFLFKFLKFFSYLGKFSLSFNKLGVRKPAFFSFLFY